MAVQEKALYHNGFAARARPLGTGKEEQEMALCTEREEREMTLCTEREEQEMTLCNEREEQEMVLDGYAVLAPAIQLYDEQLDCLLEQEVHP